MKRNVARQFVIIAILSCLTIASQAQYLWNSDSSFKAGSANSGRLWGYMFGDFYAKGHSDSAGRGSNNQYTGIPTSRNAFQFRRIYLGYDYNITNKFSAEVLLAAEDNFAAGNPPGGGATGDETLNGKLTFYIKLANIRWKNIWKGTDLVVGQVATPAFPLLSERIWAYRSIERTIADVRRTPSYDLGAALQGKFDSKGNFGYNLMVGNGSSAKPEADNFKWFYGDIWAMAMDKKLIFDIYADYERLNWTSTWHHSRQMTKAFIAYNTPALTVGVEGYINVMKNDDLAQLIAPPNPQHTADTLTSNAIGISAYVHGDIVKNKLRFFARYDNTKNNSKANNSIYKSYSEPAGNYDDNNKEQFITAGLDFTPAKGVHFMPNIWYNRYNSLQAAPAGSKLKGDYDAVYRLTFYFVFGK